MTGSSWANRKWPVNQFIMIIFQVFDKDGSGKVSANELRHVLTQLGEKLDSKDCDKLLDGHEDADGNVKYDHFIKTILSDKEEAKE